MTAGCTAALLAQAPTDTTPAPLPLAAAVARQLDALAADSLRERHTPSRGLDATARYIAGEFERLGLQPGVTEGRSPSWVQRYPVPARQRVDAANAGLYLVARLGKGKGEIVNETGREAGKEVGLDFTHDAYFTPEVGPQLIAEKSIAFQFFAASTPLAVVAGMQTAASIRRAADQLREHIAVYIPMTGTDSAAQRQIISELYGISQGVVVVRPEDSESFAAQVAAQPPTLFVAKYLQAEQTKAGRRRWPWAVSVREAGPIAGLLAGAMDRDVAGLRTTPVPLVRVLPSVGGALSAEGRSPENDTITAPNVVAILQGSDTALRREYVVLSTPLDNDGGNSAGMACLLAVAQMFSQSNIHPRRSIVFLATSGGRQEAWGANYFANHLPLANRTALAVNLTLELAGPGSADSIVLDGLQDIEGVPVLPQMAAVHPELRLRVVDGEPNWHAGADHAAFVRAAVPSLYLHGGAAAGASPAADADYVSRVAGLVFYLGEALANADRRPGWSAAGRQHLRAVLEP